MPPKLFASGVGAPEGPISLPDGSMYVTEMSADTSCVTHLDPQGRRRVIKKTGGNFTAAKAMDILKHNKTDDSPRGPFHIDPQTRDIVENIYIRRCEKVNGRVVNVDFETFPMVKDPWKDMHPQSK